MKLGEFANTLKTGTEVRIVDMRRDYWLEMQSEPRLDICEKYAPWELKIDSEMIERQIEEIEVIKKNVIKVTII